MADMVNNLQVPLAGWTVPRPVFKRLEIVSDPVYAAAGVYWAVSTTYTTGQLVNANGRIYSATVGGTSASTGTGPSSTAASITDGTITWAYVCDAAPVLLSDVKTHIRKTDSYDDQYLQSFVIPAATQMVEQYLNRRLISRKVRMWMDFLPGTGNEYTLYGAGTAQVPVRYANIGMFRWFELYGTPANNVTAINYIDNAGVSHVFDSSQYIADTTDQDMPARIILQRGSVWPVDLQVAHALNCEYSIGYGNQSTLIPFPLRQAILTVCAALYSNRGDNADQMPDCLLLPTVRAMLNPFRVLKVSTLS